MIILAVYQSISTCSPRALVNFAPEFATSTCEFFFFCFFLLVALLSSSLLPLPRLPLVIANTSLTIPLYTTLTFTMEPLNVLMVSYTPNSTELTQSNCCRSVLASTPPALSAAVPLAQTRRSVLSASVCLTCDVAKRSTSWAWSVSMARSSLPSVCSSLSSFVS